MSNDLVFQAPETIVYGKFSPASDVWSIGVVTYTMLSGYRPFSSKDTTDLLEKMRDGKVHFYPAEWKKISVEAQKFVKNLVEPDPEERMSIAEALSHPWIQTLYYENIGIDNDLNRTTNETTKRDFSLMLKKAKGNTTFALTDKQSGLIKRHRRSNTFAGKIVQVSEMKDITEDDVDKMEPFREEAKRVHEN